MATMLPTGAPETLLHQARLLLATKPDTLAVTLVNRVGETRLTYRRFFTQAARWAIALAGQGVRQGDGVILVLEHGEAVLTSFWGAMLLGAVPSIFPFLSDKLDRGRYFASVRQLAAQAGARAVLTQAAFAADLKAALADLPGLAVIAVESVPLGGGVAAYLDRPLPAPEDTAFLQHSSGSTGLQKGVMLSHRAVLNQAVAYSQAIALNSDDVIVSWLPLYHDMGLIAGFLLPMLAGVPLVLLSPFHWVREPQLLLHAITRHGGTLCWLPNFAYSFMAARVREAALEGIDLATLRAAINCSEPIRAESQRTFAERFVPFGLRPEALQTCYAMAENTFAVTQSRLGAAPPVDVVARRPLAEQGLARPAQADELTTEIVSCGWPIAGCELRVLDEAGSPLPDRQVGEIALRSPSMLSGYHQRPDLTAAALRDGWFLTGDLGYLADGELYVTGRKKDLIIVGGKNLYPQDIEALVSEVPGIYPGRVVAFGVDDPTLGTEAVAVLAEVSDAAVLDDAERRADVIRAVRAQLAQQADVAARYVELVPHLWLIKTSSGKIARAANRDKFLALRAETPSEG